MDAKAEVVQTNQPKFGDYQCNNAMALFGRLKGQVHSLLLLTLVHMQSFWLQECNNQAQVMQKHAHGLRSTKCMLNNAGQAMSDPSAAVAEYSHLWSDHAA